MGWSVLPEPGTELGPCEIAHGRGKLPNPYADYVISRSAMAGDSIKPLKNTQT